MSIIISMYLLYWFVRLIYWACVRVFPAGFMAYVERDAKKRAEAKKNEIKRSDYLKTMGNGEYRKGNYEKALIYYNQVRV